MTKNNFLYDESCMEDFTQQKILALKLGGKQKLIEFMAKETNSDEKIYTDDVIYRILKQIILELSVFVNTSVFLYDFFDSIDIQLISHISDESSSISSILVDAMISALVGVKVRSGSDYINGFSEEVVEDFDTQYGKEKKDKKK